MVTEVRKWRGDDGKLYDTRDEAVTADAYYYAGGEMRVLLRRHHIDQHSDFDDVVDVLLKEPDAVREILYRLVTAGLGRGGKTGDN